MIIFHLFFSLQGHEDDGSEQLCPLVSMVPDDLRPDVHLDGSVDNHVEIWQRAAAQ